MAEPGLRWWGRGCRCWPQPEAVEQSRTQERGKVGSLGGLTGLPLSDRKMPGPGIPGQADQ